MPAKKLVAVIDAGHGGKDPGAIWPPGSSTPELNERDLAQDITERLMLLCNRARWLQAWCCHTPDTDPSQRERGRRSREWKANISLHIHLNAAQASTAHGLRCFVYPGSVIGAAVARSILDAAPAYLHTLSGASPTDALSRVEWSFRHGKVRGYPEHLARAREVVKHAPCPSVLVEVCFLTNPADRQWISKAHNRDAFALSLMSGLRKAAAMYRIATPITGDIA